MRQRLTEAGMVLPAVLTFMIVMIIISGTVLEVIQGNLFAANNNSQRQQAFNISEAGINYYLWHLSHNPSDFKDGKTTPATPDANLGYGPYEHTYINSDGKTEGTYTLWIKPQGNGSTIATVRSIGKVKGTNVTRTIEAQIGAPSFASYGVVADGPLWFGNTESADGPVHSNVGVRMDGTNTADVTSTNSTYVPPVSLGGDGNSHPAVWCNSSVTTPVNCNTRDKSNWRFPVPTVDFNQVTNSLCTMKKVAFSSDSSTASLATQSSACTQVPSTRTAAYLPRRANNYNTFRGYLIELNSNGTYNLYNVNGETDTLRPYTNALSLASVATNITVPTNGVIFAEDNVWVRSNPTFKGRVTIGAGRLATNDDANVVIADNLLYSAKNGTDAIGLVAEGDILIAPYAPPASGNFTFEVDAAVISQAGNVEFPGTYRSSTSRCTYGWINSGQKLLYYGSVAMRQTWTWTWLQGSGACGDAVRNSSNVYVSGIQTNTTQYDYNLLYAPPPSFPITSGFSIITWREVLVVP